MTSYTYWLTTGTVLLILAIASHCRAYNRLCCQVFWHLIAWVLLLLACVALGKVLFDSI